MSHSPETYAQRRKDVCKGKVDAGPTTSKKAKKRARLGFYCMPHAFVSHEHRSDLQHNPWGFI